jgi:putative transposase
LYNAALAERREAWAMRKVAVSYGMQSAQLREIRRADPGGQGRHSFTAQQQMFVHGDGAKWQPAADGRWAHTRLQAVGTVKVRQHRPVRGTVKTLTVKWEGRRWYVIVTADAEPEPLPAAGRQAGVDVGVARFLTTSDGEVVANPRFLAESADVIADLQRRVARAQPGSGNRKRLRRALAKAHRKVRNRRRDFHHKTARALVSGYDAIAVEDLNEAAMTRKPAPKPDPEKPGACQRLRQDTVVCPTCGPHDADINAAINIATRAGLGSDQTAPAA